MDGEQTRQRILDEAEDLVQLRGYNAFSYRDLADRVGIKTASIHYHFPGKTDLAQQLVVRYRLRFEERLAAIEVAMASARRQLEGYCELFLKTYLQGGKICLCGSLSADTTSVSQETQRELARFYEANESWLIGVIKRGVGTGELTKPASYRETARWIVAALEGALLASRATGDRSWIDAARRHALAQLQPQRH